jgi:lycopene cyclase domain-containing protein
MTNALLNVTVLVALGVVVGPVLRRLRPGPLAWGAVLLVALTVVFDTLMIAADLYVFDPDRILGVYVWGAPIEDFAYALAASALMPALWTWLGRRGRAAADDRQGGGHGGGHGGGRGGTGTSTRDEDA